MKIFNSNFKNKALVAVACVAANVASKGAFAGEIPVSMAAAVRAWKCPVVYDENGIGRPDCEKNALPGYVKTHDEGEVVSVDVNKDGSKEITRTHVTRVTEFAENGNYNGTVHIHDHDIVAVHVKDGILKMHFHEDRGGVYTLPGNSY